MAKNSIENILQDKKKLIKELKVNARGSINTFAEKLEFSRQKVWRIINDLEKEKKIWGYTAVVDDNFFGFNQYIILLKRTSLPVTELIIDLITSREVKNKLAEMEIDIVGSYYVHGEYDWVIDIKAKDIKQVKSIVEIFYKQLKNVISDIKILEVIYPMQKCGIENPYPEKIKEFF
jgi:DNA-binding Lrp family transcriptional regulator